MVTQKITPFLWFDANAEDAANYYVSVFKDAKIVSINRYGEGMPFPKGTAMVVNFELNGQHFTALNGGARYAGFRETISFVIHCEDQQEVDYYWEQLSADGGQTQACGWLKDKFGLSWQIVPKGLGTLMSGKNSDKVAQALMGMIKIDIATLQKLKEE